MTNYIPEGPLELSDAFITRLIELERDRQNRKLVMIASESVCPRAVREALACEFSNIYAEGYPSPRMIALGETALESLDETFAEFRRYGDRRYYKGCDYVNLVESVARRRLVELFANDRVPAERLHANVQPLSGAAANNAVYNAFIKNGDRIMGMSLVTGGHLTHGSPVNRSGRSYQVSSYTPSRSGKLDYDEIRKQAKAFRPAILVAGFSAYPWDLDWPTLRGIADEVGCVLFADIAHTAGLVAAGVLTSPVGYADVISFTTHKSLCGPRGAAILTMDETAAKQVDMGVFPGEQGGPHVNQIAAKAVAFGLARRPGFKELMQKVKENALALADGFTKRGLKLAYGGTNTHLCLVDLKSVKTASGRPVTGEIASRLLDLCGLTCNKNTIMGDASATQPTGLRFGTVWVTQRGLGPAHMDRIADVVVKALRGLHAYAYVYGGSEVGRAKLDWPVLEEVQGTLAAIAAEAHDPSPGDGSAATYPHRFTGVGAAGAPRRTPLAEAHRRAGATLVTRAGWEVPRAFAGVDAETAAGRAGCALLDLGDADAIRVEGGRAEKLLQGTLAADLLGLDQDRALRSLLLDAAGAPLDVVTVARLSAPVTEPDAFLVVTRGGQGPRVTTWLRALSDGYVLHSDDLYRKVEGPAVVRPLAETSSVTLVALVGPKALATLAKALPGAAGLAAGQVRRIDGTVVLATADAVEQVVVLVPTEAAPALWSKLVEAGATPAGADAEAALAHAQGLPAVGEATPAGADLVKAAPGGLIGPCKPFFVGQAAGAAAACSATPRPDHDFAVPELPVRYTCLHAEHLKLTEKRFMVPFAGWEMPVWYQGIGIEHRAVRCGAGLFDVSHMGVLQVRGRHAERLLDLVTTNYVPWLKPGNCHYSYLLAPDGHVIDDIIIYREATDRFMVVVNASNAERDEAWLRAVAADQVLIDAKHPHRRIDATAEIVNLKTDEREGDNRRVDVAFQGPASLPTLCRLADGPTFARELRELGRFCLASGSLAGMKVLVARTGYTGEDIAYELFVHPDQAPKLWSTILEAGKDLGVIPTGLGSRDSTRTEAGLPLHGHELAGPNQVNPFEAGYAPFVRLHKPWFIGRDACVHAVEHWTREVVRFQVNQKGGKGLHPGNKVVDAKKGQYLGLVTSAAVVGRQQIGLALIDRRYAKVGDALLVYPQGEKDKEPEARKLSELHDGDRVPLALEATILRRFARPAEMHAAAEREE
jgi:glycine cleavage system T protein